MPDPCDRSFDEALLSGYLDGALVQTDEQRVRLHLEDCSSCRTLVAELRAAREETISTTFETPRDDEWPEAPQSGTSRLARGIGMPLALAWLILTIGYAVWEGWQNSEHSVERVIVVGGISAFVLLFLGVLLDRLKATKTDRYRGVYK